MVSEESSLVQLKTGTKHLEQKQIHQKTELKKIFLVSTSSKYLLDKDLTSYSFALGYLSGCLPKGKYDIEVQDAYCEKWETGRKKFIKILETFKPDVVGFNMITMNRWTTYEAVRIIKEKLPNTKILVGGCHATIMWKQLLENFPFDAVVIGEGEITFPELLDALENGKDLRIIDGIAFKENGEIIKNQPRKLVEDLDTLPSVNNDYFLNENSKVAFMLTSRGCPHLCSFCSTSLHWERRCRSMSAKAVLDEIERVLEKYPKVEEVRFMDDVFTIDNGRVIEICKGMIERKFNLKWRCSGRVYPISAEMIRWMEKAGCIMIGFGVETGSQKLLDQLGKAAKVEQIIEAYKTIYENSTKIVPDTYLIVGLPGEDENTVNETIEMIKKINKIGKRPLFLTSARILEIYPGTRLYGIAKSRGMVDDDFWIKSDDTPKFREHTDKWLKKQRRKILIANWTSSGVMPVAKIIWERKMWKPRKIWNIVAPYMRKVN